VKVLREPARADRFVLRVRVQSAMSSGYLREQCPMSCNSAATTSDSRASASRAKYAVCRACSGHRHALAEVRAGAARRVDREDLVGDSHVLPPRRRACAAAAPPRCRRCRGQVAAAQMACMAADESGAAVQNPLVIKHDNGFRAEPHVQLKLRIAQQGAKRR